MSEQLHDSEQGTDPQGDHKAERHKKAMQKQKAKVDASIAAASTERGVAVLLTGNGKGKSSSAFGMVLRALGYGQKVGVVQFIKGAQLSGEELYLKNQCPQVELHQMGTGFTWNTQDRSADIAAAEATWQHASRMLADPGYDLVVLDELTYMLGYQYLDEARVLQAIAQRPSEQSVIVTGRGGGTALQELMDTVSEVKDLKHAFKAGIKARQGVDY
ncbi:cob(I)yrinic acid a,c-diamide adenosyltransferase [Cellvibrio japonicus]|uniref:Corrinoid adenosyltransferase n=1 Tax=Cellvibrio japonicus (strain Ueda107) TaxID=498211 RepID=B3PIP2_CELJU|nr:cob(I)yrinic acid a,c-diamide adenosyltransferase [Cellvibrio japonicus]ACE84180.1 cob(I)alamin adenosyltransferase [Cellvibrio japonicus Ueda107]QEI13959.1 cob(I)yrinic acid a,c-diamide adenosyltransferase [Cellvibrio japonicus]QEI17533.1 cob(I)yrinic acid a,c-diamide adenosyltransferase [Cellvibrio japonicus]QEI21109.1 cob(I)yrinic acid a,c-diamide adenosyltransferase [Cellvibrio japonicus]